MPPQTDPARVDHPALHVPPAAGLDAAREAAMTCQACDLWERATQTVFGVGGRNVPLMLVGEQPGDREDLAGRPFVGPAGGILDDALVAAGIDRERVGSRTRDRCARARRSRTRNDHAASEQRTAIDETVAGNRFEIVFVTPGDFHVIPPRPMRAIGFDIADNSEDRVFEPSQELLSRGHGGSIRPPMERV